MLVADSIPVKLKILNINV
jgi:hypothetical protein